MGTKNDGGKSSKNPPLLIVAKRKHVASALLQFFLNYWGFQYQTYTISSRNIDRSFHVFRVTYYDRMIWLILLKRQNFSVKNEMLNNPAEENTFPHNIYLCNLSHLYINMWSFNLPYTVNWDANRYLIIYVNVYPVS